MEINEMTLEQIETRKAEIETLLTNEDADLDALQTEIEALEQRKADIKVEIENRKNLVDAVIADGVETAKVEERENIMTNMEVRNTKQYIDAFANYIKSGKDDECRALLTENVEGMIPVPEFVETIIAEAFKESKILSRIRKTYARGNVKIPFEYSAPIAEAHTEGTAAVQPEDLKIGFVAMAPKTWKKLVQLSDESVDLQSGEALVRYVYDEIARGIVKAREKAVLDAILAAPQTATKDNPSVAKTGEAKGAITDIINAEALLGAGAEDLVVLINKADYAMYKGLQFGASYAVDPFDGMEVIKTEYATVPVVGDLRGALENFVRGNEEIQMKYDDRSDMAADLVNILGRLPSAIAVVGDKFFAKVSA